MLRQNDSPINIFTVFVLLMFFASAACADERLEIEETQNGVDGRIPLAVVNGVPFYQSDVIEHGKRRGYRVIADKIQDPANLRLWLIDLVEFELLRQEAMKQNLQQDPDTHSRLQSYVRSILADAATDAYLATNPITEEDLKERYEIEVDTHEYKARHILVSTQEKAKSLISELNNGASFEDLAKEESEDRVSAEKGGDLGWFRKEAMVPTFSNAAARLEIGEFSQLPVNSRFGWHVIRLDDRREVERPSFKSTEIKLRKQIRQERIQTHLFELKQNADINIK